MTQPDKPGHLDLQALQRMNATQARTITELREELRDAQAGKTPVDPDLDRDLDLQSAPGETWQRAVTRLTAEVIRKERQLRERDEQILREREQNAAERQARLVQEADRLERAENDLTEALGVRDGLMAQHERDGVRIESLVGQLGRTRQELTDLRGEIDEYRRHVRDVLIRIATANRWDNDSDGVLDSMLDELGLDRIEREYVVPVEVTVHQHVNVTVRATSPVEAAREAERHETIDRLMTWKPEEFEGWRIEANEDLVEIQGGGR